MLNAPQLKCHSLPLCVKRLSFNRKALRDRARISAENTYNLQLVCQAQELDGRLSNPLLPSCLVHSQLWPCYYILGALFEFVVIVAYISLIFKIQKSSTVTVFYCIMLCLSWSLSCHNYWWFTLLDNIPCVHVCCNVNIHQLGRRET